MTFEETQLMCWHCGRPMLDKTEAFCSEACAIASEIADTLTSKMASECGFCGNVIYSGLDLCMSCAGTEE